MYAVRVDWDLDAERLEETFLKLHPDGWRVAALSKYGTAKAPLHAVLWYQTFGPQQRIVADCDPIGLLTHPQAQRVDGFYPAIASGTGDVLTAFTLVFEELRPMSARVQPPALVGPASWEEFSKTTGTFHQSLRIRSIDLVLRPRSDPGTHVRGRNDNPGVMYGKQVDRITEDPSLFYMATLWPQDMLEPWAFSNVKIAVAAPDWRWQWPTQVMRAHSEVVGVVGARSSDEEPDPVLTLWRDVKYSPWPVPNPFAFEPMAILERLRVDRESSQTVDAKFSTRFGGGYFPIGLSAYGDSVDDATFHLVWAPRESSFPLPRKFVKTGPGDGTPYEETQDEHIGVSRVLRGRIRGAGAVQARRVSELYDDEVLEDGRIWVQPRLPPLPSSTLRGGIPPTGSGGPGAQSEWHGPPTEAPPPSPPPTAYVTFDTIMERAMRRCGARAAYLVVLRAGEAKFARALTLAEEGYPVTRLHQPFRVGSVAKPITATLMVHQARDHAGGLSQRLADVLQVSPRFASLADATIEQVLRHGSGLQTTSPPHSYDFHILEYVNEAPAPGDAPAVTLQNLGTVRRFYERYDEPGGVPGEEPYIEAGARTARYNNWGYTLLGEALAFRARGNFELWPTAIAAMLGRAGASTDNVLGGRTYGGCAARNEVLYHSRPGVGPRRWSNEEEPLPFVAVPYDQDVDLLGCATAIVISPLDMAAFLGAMTPRSGRFTWLTPDELRELYQPSPTVNGSEGIGWGAKNVGWTSRLGGVQRDISVISLQHNGQLAGCAGWIEHRVPSRNLSPTPGAPPGPVPPVLDPADTLSIAIAFNADPVVDWPTIVGEVVAHAQRIELDDAWPAGDVLAGTG